MHRAGPDRLSDSEVCHDAKCRAMIRMVGSISRSPVARRRHEQSAALNFKRVSDSKSQRILIATDHYLNPCWKAFDITHGYAQRGDIH